MKLTDKLTLLMEEHGYNKRTLSQQANIPYTTIVGLYTKGYEGARINTLKSLASFFGITLESLCRDEIDQIEYVSNSNITESAPSSHEQALIDSYRKLNGQGQAYIDQTIEMALQNSAFTDTGQRSAQIS